eukprot:GILK01002351.1.p1 GENE.GILK01002351.1~~GILK01002351.1.p1  ORF type:complete len:1062 (-),score=193.43 GILK01002351.1:67-3252(-)
MSGSHLSKELFELVKAIGESRSKQEEDKIIVNEVSVLKTKINESNIPAKKMKEYLIRAIYVEMLGHDASFAYIHAVKLAHDKALLAKRIGYLTANLCLHKDHELMLLLVNTIQKDLNSANQLEICAALISVSKLVNAEMIPAVLPATVKLLSHPQEAVRKKAVMAMHRFYQLSNSSVADHIDKLRRALCDKDPGVMGATLHVLHDMAKDTPQTFKDLIPSFVSILKQVTEHRLPREYDYHRMPAPWLQIRLLQILAIVGADDQRASEGMYEVLHEVMKRADTGINVGYAIVYECVKTIAKIYPNQPLLEAAATSISRFISSDNHNLKYLGVNGLASVVQVNPRYAAEHQMVVVECMEDPDETLKRKTLDLLFRMTNAANVVVVVDRLTFYLKSTVDAHLRTELVTRITQLAERYAPNNGWFIQTMNQVFELGGELVRPEVAHNLLRLIAEGGGDEDSELRAYAVKTYLKALEKPFLPDILVQTIAWVLGEYGYLATKDASLGYSLDDVIELMCEAVDRQFEDPCTRGWIVTAIMKLTAQLGTLTNQVQVMLARYGQSRSVDIQQRCYEFAELARDMGTMREVLPVDASCEDLEPDENLSFLDIYVQDALQHGAKPYSPPDLSGSAAVPVLGEAPKASVLNFTPYERPTTMKMPSFNLAPGASGSGFANSGPAGNLGALAGTGLNVAPATSATTGLRVQQKKWGPEGYNEDKKTAAAASPFSSGPSAAAHNAPPPPPPPTGARDSFTSTSKTPLAAPQPRVLSEKDKLAAALFGGLTDTTHAAPAKTGASVGGFGATSTTRPAARSSVGAKKPSPTPPTSTPTAAHYVSQSQPQQPQSQSIMGDLLDLDFDAPLPSTPVMPAASTSPILPHSTLVGSTTPPPRSNDVDLLSLDLMGSAPSASVPKQPLAADPYKMDALLNSIPAPSFQPTGLTSMPSPGVPAVLGLSAAGVSMEPTPLTPAALTTAQFGSSWGGHNEEKRFVISPSSVHSPDEFMNRVRSRLMIQPVEVIGVEAIAAGKRVGSNDLCLVHGKVGPTGLEMIVRTANKQFTDLVADLCMKHLR